MKALLFCFVRPGCYLEERLLLRDLLILLASVHMPFTAPKYWDFTILLQEGKIFHRQNLFQKKKNISLLRYAIIQKACVHPSQKSSSIDISWKNYIEVCWYMD